MKNNIIYALGIHEGGGKRIIHNLINQIKSNNVFLMLDNRLKSINSKVNYNYYKPSFLFRIIYEYKLKKYDINDNIIFINGLPPLFKIKARSIVFLMNLNAITFPKNSFFQWLFSLNFLRYIKFCIGKNNVDEWVVFSNTSKKRLLSKIKKTIPIKILNISLDKFVANSNLRFQFDFIYPAGGEKHKNHLKLIEALIILSKKGFFPKIFFTLKDSDYTNMNIKYFIKKYNLKIYNQYFENHENLIEIYNLSKAIMFPSLHESLGLPLIEGLNLKKDIIASEMDYVRDQVSPVESFDPNSSLSIARAISRYLKYDMELEDNLDHKLLLDYLFK